MKIKLLKYLLIGTILSAVLGEMFSLPVGVPGVNIYPLDIFALLILVYWLLQPGLLKKLVWQKRQTGVFVLFLFFAILSVVFTPFHLTPVQKLISSLYIVRLAAFFTLFLSAGFLLSEKAVNLTIYRDEINFWTGVR